MDIRWHIDPETELPHIYNHGVREHEVEDVLRHPGDDFSGADRTRVSFGKTRGGRYLKVIYVPDEGLDSVFVITAYDLCGRALQAFRRRMRRKGL